MTQKYIKIFSVESSFWKIFIIKKTYLSINKLLIILPCCSSHVPKCLEMLMFQAFFLKVCLCMCVYFKENNKIIAKLAFCLNTLWIAFHVCYFSWLYSSPPWNWTIIYSSSCWTCVLPNSYCFKQCLYILDCYLFF